MSLSNRIKFKEIIVNIQEHCIELSVSEVEKVSLIKIKVWCEKYIGQERITHPLYEIVEGKLVDFNDTLGLWAVDTPVYDGSYLFWFLNKNDQIFFKLTWC